MHTRPGDFTEITNRINAHYPIERMYRTALADVRASAQAAIDRIDAAYGIESPRTPPRPFIEYSPYRRPRPIPIFSPLGIR